MGPKIVVTPLELPIVLGSFAEAAAARHRLELSNRAPNEDILHTLRRFTRVIATIACTLLAAFLIWKFIYKDDDVNVAEDKNQQLENQQNSSAAMQVVASIYYETLNLHSIKFFKRQLWPTYEKLKNFNNVKFDLIPYGKATYQAQGKTWNFVCDHGPPECKANKLQACAIKVYPQQEHFVPFANCIMTSRLPLTAGERCSKTARIEWERMQECYDGNEGNEYLHEMGLRTESLHPHLLNVPWIAINGQYTDDMQLQASGSLLWLICRSFKSSKPSTCP